MNIFNIVSQNLLSPAILFFIVGIIAGLMKSDLEIPESISSFLTIYLMIAIGFKGGVSVATVSAFHTKMILTILMGVVISFSQPFLCYFLLKYKAVDKPTAAAIAANYGSISIVTFVAATNVLNMNNISYAGYIVAVVALMEAPAIVSGLFIANKKSDTTKKVSIKSKELLSNGTILLLILSFIVGWITGKPGFDKMAGFIDTPFQGILALFLLDMGLKVSRELEKMQGFSVKLALFGIYMPMIGATIGLVISLLLGLDLGTGILFMILCASASYIAVPAAMRTALPEAQVAIYMPMSLAITFPFNIALGIPIYFSIAKALL